MKKYLFLTLGLVSFNATAKIDWQEPRARIVSGYEAVNRQIQRTPDPRRLAAFVVEGNLLLKEEVDQIDEEAYLEMYVTWQIQRARQQDEFLCGFDIEACREEGRKRLAEYCAIKASPAKVDQTEASVKKTGSDEEQKN